MRLLLLLLMMCSMAQATSVNLTWEDNLNDPAIVGGYNVHVGNQSGTYTDIFDAGPALSFTVYPLDNNTLYYFAATAYPLTADYKESGYSNEVSVTTPPAPLTVDFKASVTTGRAPLIINFTSIFNGPVLTCKWNFGDKSTSTSCNPVHKYRYRGTYTVRLTATNSVGPVTTTKTNYITVTR